MAKLVQSMDIRNNVMGKQDELQKKSTVYSTKRIKELTDEAINENAKPDTTPFFSGKTEWRDAGVMFEYTDEEMEELTKCANDCEYFVANYCKFLNSKGRTLVKLRNYQSRILKVMSAEKWDGKTETVIPEHPEIVLLQARQTAKCLSMDSDIIVPEGFAYETLNANDKKYRFAKYLCRMMKFLSNIVR